MSSQNARKKRQAKKKARIQATQRKERLAYQQAMRERRAKRDEEARTKVHLPDEPIPRTRLVDVTPHDTS